MSDSTMAAICCLTALVALVVFFCWLFKDLGKPATSLQETPLMAKKEEADQDTDNTRVLIDVDGTFINTVEKSCLDCQHSFTSANNNLACDYFKIANPINEKRVLVNCNAARLLYKLCGREARFFSPKEQTNE